jgi:exopolysaccharide production protein ExoQ
MINTIDSHTTKASKSASLPWLLFLFLAAVFFFAYHDVSQSQNLGGDQTTEDLVATLSQGQLGRRLALLSLGVVAVVSLVRGPAKKRLSTQGPLGWLLVGFLSWALLSPVWAQDPSQTVKKLAVFAILCLGAVALVRRLSLREIVLWTFFTSSAFLVIGILVAVVNGTFEPFSPGYRFAGTLPPNNEGINCALLLLSAMTLADLMKPRRVLFWACGFIGLVFLILSGSRTGTAAAIVAAVIYLVVVRSRSTKFTMALSAAMAICFLAFFVGTGLMPGLKNVVLLGRDDGGAETFTGRTGIWDDVNPYIHQAPILGYGYGGFWTPTHIEAVSDQEQWAVGNGHSAYIDFLLMLGVLGLIAFVLILVFGISYAFRAFRFSQRPAFAFCGVVLVFCAMDGLFESDINEGSLLMFVSTIILVRLAFVPLYRTLRTSSEIPSSSQMDLVAHA